MSTNTRSRALHAALAASFAAGFGGLAASSASATTVSLALSNTMVLVSDTTGVTDNLDATRLPGTNTIQIRSNNGLALTAGAGCIRPVSTEVRCTSSAINVVNVLLSTGNDRFIAGSLDRRVTASGGSGNDRIDGGSLADWINGSLDSDVLNGNGGADEIHGTSGNDTINGGNGNDTIYGDDGDDTLAGNLDSDWLQGGTGFDRVDGDNPGDIANGSNDTIDIRDGANDVAECSGGTGDTVQADLFIPGTLTLIDLAVGSAKLTFPFNTCETVNRI